MTLDGLKKMIVELDIDNVRALCCEEAGFAVDDLAGNELESLLSCRGRFGEVGCRLAGGCCVLLVFCHMLILSGKATIEKGHG